MMNTLTENSDIFKEKWKFFLYRGLTYFSFLFIPILLQKVVSLNLLLQTGVLTLYMMFMLGQWYLLGKEIDHRFKIYYRVNSSLERVMYRLLAGNACFIFIFNIFYLFPSGALSYIFWGFFFLIGLFYSWPTRGKIIEESITRQFSEFKYLDSFEKTVLALTVVTFIFSFPEIPLFQNIEALKLYFDPSEKIHQAIWSFLTVNYHPFSKHALLFNLTWSYHFYFFGFGAYLLAAYSLFRYFLSRRLSILGIFAIVSSWSFAKQVELDFISSVTTTFHVIWLWSLIWCSRSSTYRSGLFIGLIHFIGALLNAKFLILMPFSLALFMYTMKDNTIWYKKQWLKYTLLGVTLSLIVGSSHFESIELLNGQTMNALLDELSLFLRRKAFYSLSIFGGILFSYLLIKHDSMKKNSFSFDIDLYKFISLAIMSLFLIGIFFEKDYFRSYTLIWILAFLSLVPLEFIFQSIRRLRSKRNIIYALYILICLLDSHFEGRVRTFGKLFFDQELLKYINQM